MIHFLADRAHEEHDEDVLGMPQPSSGVAAIDGHDVEVAPAAVWSRVGHLVDQ
jgi:hypothetical protein